MDPISLIRRRWLGALTAGLGGLVGQPVLAALAPTPRQTPGPFYPETLPLDRDNDLTRVDGRDGRAQGEYTELGGRVVDARGRPLAGVQVEIWQCNAFGRYHHPRDNRGVSLDPYFQGYGSFTTGADGGYRFRTIKPVSYPGRTPHIHFALSGPGVRAFTTQLYVAGEPANERDFVLNSIRDPQARKRLIVPFEAGRDTPWRAHFELVAERV